MKKRLESFVNEGISVISSLISENTSSSKNKQSETEKVNKNNKTVDNLKNDQFIDENVDNSVFYDADDSETYLFDDSIGFSQELIVNKDDEVVEEKESEHTVDVEKQHIKQLNHEITDLQEKLDQSRSEIDFLKENQAKIIHQAIKEHAVHKQMVFNYDNIVLENILQAKQSKNISEEKVSVVELDHTMENLSIHNKDYRTVSKSYIDTQSNNVHSAKYSTSLIEKLSYSNDKKHESLIETGISQEERSTTNISFSETNRLLCALREKDNLIKDINQKMENLYTEKAKLELSLNVLQKDLIRSQENKEMYTFLASEEIESLKNTIESLRDQLEFERSKNNKIKADLIDTRKKCVEMVVAVEILTKEM
ncbi:hypothetical protein M153_1100033081 [Pseudoloma neurophilia]|uniref:Uncharacterized protein n=1 Tax=Pseudoloma neurophilia TaxID=146866 RepID=A0A0R0M860_9MICR|nr:hypothetical protein M153_1100033081 [Pseudoloma neurophilia]